MKQDNDSRTDALGLDMEGVKTCSLTALVKDYLTARNGNWQRNPLDWREEHAMKQAFRLLVDCFPYAEINDIDGETLEKYQRFLAEERKYARSQCNRFVKLVKRVFDWASRQKPPIISEARAFAIGKVPKLLPSPRIRENKKRKPCPIKYVDSCFPLLRPVIADILRIESIQGMRPGEPCYIKPCDIDFDFDGVNWLYMPDNHKTASRGKERPFVFCRATQEILTPYLRLDEPEKTVFRNARGGAMRPEYVSRAVNHAIKKHGLPKFVPYQTRHLVATETAKKYKNLEEARALLGHSDVKMTSHYVDADVETIKRIADDRNKEFFGKRD
jgi:integrase